MEKDLYREMHDLEIEHWWFRGKRRIVLDLVKRYVDPPHRPSFLDLGCGTGAMLADLEPLGDVNGVDVSEEALSYAASQTRAGLLRADIPGGLAELEETYDCVLLLDLLEHLEADLETLRAASRLLAPGGVVLVTVPAYQWLYSPRDKYHHHLRRYSLAAVRDLHRRAGLRLELSSYYNSLLFGPAAVVRTISRIRKEEPGPDLSLPPPPVNRMLEGLFASERFLLPYVTLPFGLSVIAVSREWSAD